MAEPHRQRKAGGRPRGSRRRGASWRTTRSSTGLASGTDPGGRTHGCRGARTVSCGPWTAAIHALAGTGPQGYHRAPGSGCRHRRTPAQEDSCTGGRLHCRCCLRGGCRRRAVLCSATPPLLCSALPPLPPRGMPLPCCAAAVFRCRGRCQELDAGDGTTLFMRPQWESASPSCRKHTYCG